MSEQESGRRAGGGERGEKTEREKELALLSCRQGFEFPNHLVVLLLHSLEIPCDLVHRSVLDRPELFLHSSNRECSFTHLGRYLCNALKALYVCVVEDQGQGRKYANREISFLSYRPSFQSILSLLATCVNYSFSKNHSHT